MAHWTPSKSHTYEGAGQFCGRLIFSFVLNSHLFLPFPYLGILRFCTLQNGPQILIRKLSFFAPSLECEPCQCEQKSQKCTAFIWSRSENILQTFFYKQYKAAFSLGISLICLAQFQMLKCMNSLLNLYHLLLIFSVAHICLQYVINNVINMPFFRFKSKSMCFNKNQLRIPFSIESGR